MNFKTPLQLYLWLINMVVNFLLCLFYPGCGLNVTNSDPTTCLNDIVKAYSEEHSVSLAPLSLEQVLAVTLNQLELLWNQFQKFGPASFLDEYYEKWLHR